LRLIADLERVVTLLVNGALARHAGRATRFVAAVRLVRLRATRAQALARWDPAVLAAGSRRVAG